MMNMRALAMVGQHLNDPALIDTTMPASFNHQLELALQSSEASNSLLNLNKASPGDTVRGRAGLMRVVLERQQRANGIDIEAEFARMSDEGKPAETRRLIAALVTFAAVGRHKQADAFIVANRRYLDAALTGCIADCDLFHIFPLAPLVTRGCRKDASI